MPPLRALAAFLVRHRLFATFFVLSLFLNTYLLVHRDKRSTEFVTCSTFDRGPVGTYALYMDLTAGGVPARRLQLSPYRELDLRSDSSGTLLVLSTRTEPQPWEWDRILDWVSHGNRLVTAGLRGPRLAWYEAFDGYLDIKTSRTAADSISVLLPLDTLYPYPRRLPPSRYLGALTILNTPPPASADSLALRWFVPRRMHSNTLPFLASGDKPIAVKKAVGRGEWVSFTAVNPFCNELLRDSSWYDFALRLLVHDPRYGGRALLFDEFHNGYRASQSLWQLLVYYRFDAGLFMLGAVVLLYLFFSGVRILTPSPRFERPETSPLAGLAAAGSLFVRHRAYAGLLARETAMLCGKGGGARRLSPPNIEGLVKAYFDKSHRPLPGETPQGILAQLRIAADPPEVVGRKEAVDLCNLLVHIRKELRT